MPSHTEELSSSSHRLGPYSTDCRSFDPHSRFFVHSNGSLRAVGRPGSRRFDGHRPPSFPSSRSHPSTMSRRTSSRATSSSAPASA